MKPATFCRAVLSATAVGATVMLALSVTESQPPSALRLGTPPSPIVVTTTSGLTVTGEQLADRAEQAIQQAVPGSKVGMLVYDRSTGASLIARNADDPFASMSVVKLLIAVDLLVRHGHRPDAETQNQITQMLAASDDTLASSFWVSGGQGAIVDRVARLAGLTGTAPPKDPGRWGDTQITARDVVMLYRYITDRLPAASRELILHALAGAQRIAADGKDQFFGIPNGLPDTTWAIKQGWGSSGNSAVYATTGLVGPNSRYVVVVLVSGPLSRYRQLDEALTEGTAQLAPILAGAQVTP